MGFNVYKHDANTSNFKDTPIYKACNWSISMSNMGINKSLFPSIDGLYIPEIHGIAEEPIGISYSTEWGDSPGATLVEKTQEFTRASAFKLFGGSSFDPNPATNEWTQKFPKDGSYITAAIKFRAFKTPDSNNTTSYLTIIKWLTYMTSPLHDFSLKTEMQNISHSIINAKKKGEDFAEAMNGLFGNDNNLAVKNKEGQDSTQAAESIGKIRSIVADIQKLLTGMATSSRGAITAQFSFGNVFQKSNSVDWIIKEWSFTPSVETSEGDYPLWVDFNISLETNQKLSNKLLKTIVC